MRRDDPRTITYLLVFLAFYVLVTGTLIILLHGLLLQQRIAQNAALEQQASSLSAQAAERAKQEHQVISELISTSGAQNFEQAYQMILDNISSLKQQVRQLDVTGGQERQARLAAQATRDELYSQVQALTLENQRLQANLQTCRAQASACNASLATC